MDQEGEVKKQDEHMRQDWKEEMLKMIDWIHLMNLWIRRFY